MKQQRNFQIKPMEVLTGVLIAVGMMILLSVVGAILIHKSIVSENNQVHIAIIIHFMAVCISSFAIQLIYGGENMLRIFLIPCIYFLFLLVLHMTMKGDFCNALPTFVSTLGGVMPVFFTVIFRKKGKNRGYKYRFR